MTKTISEKDKYTFWTCKTNMNSLVLYICIGNWYHGECHCINIEWLKVTLTSSLSSSCNNKMAAVLLQQLQLQFEVTRGLPTCRERPCCRWSTRTSTSCIAALGLTAWNTKIIHFNNHSWFNKVPWVSSFRKNLPASWCLKVVDVSSTSFQTLYYSWHNISFLDPYSHIFP